MTPEMKASPPLPDFALLCLLRLLEAPGERPRPTPRTPKRKVRRRAGPVRH